MRKHLLLACLLSGTWLFSTAQYCLPEYTAGTTDNDYINGVSINTIVNLDNGPGDGTGFTDYTDLNTDLGAGLTYDFFVDNTDYFNEYYRVYIDYNHDDVFSSTEEITTTFTLAAGASTTFSFTVPTDVTFGETRLRVRCVFGSADFDACTTETYGEVEDYTVNLIGIDDDLSVATISDIADACTLGTDESVTVLVSNTGINPASGFDIRFSVDGGAVITESYPGVLLPGSSNLYTFTAGADLSADGTHLITAWTDYDADTNPGNDSSEIEVMNTYTYLTTGFAENICYAGGTIFPSPIAGGGTWSGDGIINASTGELNPDLVGGIGSSTDITYTFTPTTDYTVTEIPYTAPLPVATTELSLGDDETANGISIGFPFTFFGNTYTTLFISSNGIIGFSAPSNSYNPQHFPTLAYPNNIIAFCWTDLNPGDGGTISYETTGIAPHRKFTVFYDDVAHYGGGGASVSGYIVLYESSNAIDIVATNIETDLGVMTQGIENIPGNTAYVADEMYNLEAWSMVEQAWRYAVTPCAATVTETINFITPPDISIEDVTVCVGTDVTLDAGPGAEFYIWNTGETDQTISVTESGIYTVTYYANPACAVSDSALVTIHPLPALDLGDDGEACEGTMLDAGNPGSLYAWSTGATTQTLFITESGTYDVFVENPVTGCTNTDTISMIITPLPDAAFIATATELTVTCTSLAIGAETWFWDFGDGSISTEENPWHTYPFAGDYTISLVVTNSCGADIASEIVQATTDIHHMQAQSLVVYPNPASEMIHVDVAQLSDYTMLNALGQIVQQGSTTGMVNVEQLSSGAYILQLETEGMRFIGTFIRE